MSVDGHNSKQEVIDIQAVKVKVNSFNGSIIRFWRWDRLHPVPNGTPPKQSTNSILCYNYWYV